MTNVEQTGEVPTQVATVLPTATTGIGHTQAIVASLQAEIADIKNNIKDIKGHRHSDFVFLISVFAAGFLILAGLFGFGFFRLDDRFEKLSDRLLDKMDKLSSASVRSDTKLEDLLQRIPPAVSPAPKH